MVDRLRVERLLRRIADELAFLEAEARADEARRADSAWLRGVKYAFVTVIESCVDVAQHLCATSGWGPPDDNGDAMRLLGSHGVLDPDSAVALRQAVGFRNVLVHAYAEVDDGVVLRRLADVGDLRSFVAQVAEHITR